MGGCAVIDRKKQNHVKIKETYIYTLDYTTNGILKYSSVGSIEKFQISCKETIPKYSAFIYSEPNIYIVGGSDSESPLKAEAFSINLETLTLSYLATLPMPSKHGDLYHYADYLYYVGAVHLLNYMVTPTPFLRLSRDSPCWEILNENVFDTKQRKITSELMRPGSCILNNHLFVIGGEFVRNHAERKFNSDVYLFDLDTLTIDNLEYKGISIVAPKCITTNGMILVLGGFLNHESNFDIWLIGENSAKIADTGLKISGNKSIHKIPGFFVIIGNNKIKKLRDDKMTWKVESIVKSNIKVIGEIKEILNRKKEPQVAERKNVLPQYFEETEKSSNFDVFRHESRKYSPSNAFNSQIDFDYSQTFQVAPQKELSGINSIIENLELK